jgi:hypothetical protein|nr:MAG TPA: restriction alleviation protein [Caudoviricetes sp.]
MSENNKPCPQFPYWGASYPDACCVNGELQDLDYCDENGNLYDKGEGVPCPFCRTEEFIEYDPFSKEDEFYEGIEDEDKAKEKAREWYLNWIEEMKKKYS